MPHQKVFSVGDVVVYPCRGIGSIKDIETQEVAGHSLQVYVISFNQDKLILRLPLSKARSAGLRSLSSTDALEKAFSVLKTPPQIKKLMWSKRAQEYELKINSGNPASICEVLRDLYKPSSREEQSFSERQLYQAALHRLALEAAEVQQKPLDQIIESIEHQLSMRYAKAS